MTWTRSFWPISVIVLTEKLPLTINRIDRLRIPSLLLLLSLIFVTGCGYGRPHHVVKGTVKFNKDDSVARFGMIEFRSESEPIVTARSTISPDGTFSLRTGDRKGAVAGWHTVVVMQLVRKYNDEAKHSHGLEAAKKYRDHRTTDLRVEVTETSGEEGLTLTIDHLTK